MNRRRFTQTVAGGLLPAAGFPVRGFAAADVGWSHYQGDQQATRYSPLNQITASNVQRLKPAWVHHGAAENSRYRGSVECTPVVVDGVMYIVGADLVIRRSTRTGSYGPLRRWPAREPSSGCMSGRRHWKGSGGGASLFRFRTGLVPGCPDRQGGSVIRHGRRPICRRMRTAI
jgi:hypothetical protein